MAPSTSAASTPPETTPPEITSAETATSATTLDVPAFGWSAYAERVNGRFAMVGFVAVLLVEAISGDTFLRWAGLLP
jgi:cell division protein FtsN